MPLISILESKSQLSTQIFKSLKLVSFLLKRLNFALFVKSRLTPLEEVSRVSSYIFYFFYFFYFLIFFEFLKKNQKNCHVSSYHHATWK